MFFNGLFHKNNLFFENNDKYCDVGINKKKGRLLYDFILVQSIESNIIFSFNEQRLMAIRQWNDKLSNKDINDYINSTMITYTRKYS